MLVKKVNLAQGQFTKVVVYAPQPKAVEPSKAK